MTEPTLIILNPQAGGGRAGRLWTQLEPLLWQRLGALIVAITERPDEVAPHIDAAYGAGVRRVIAIGGDGTNHTLVNALAAFTERTGAHMVYGNLPIGTGQDWARGRGAPLRDLAAAARWIAEAQPAPTDLGLMTADSGRAYFLNIASVGLGGDVVERVRRRRRHPLVFLQASVESLLRYRPPHLCITLDGEVWYDDRAYIVAVANGSYFGRGMHIAPEAQADDGLFEVVLVEAVSRLRILSALERVYRGTHLTHPAVRTRRARHVQVVGASPVGVELDGELGGLNTTLAFAVQPRLLHMLT